MNTYLLIMTMIIHTSSGVGTVVTPVEIKDYNSCQRIGAAWVSRQKNNVKNESFRTRVIDYQCLQIEYRIVESGIDFKKKGYEYIAEDDSKSWYLDGQYHRVDGPCYIAYNKNEIYQEHWAREGNFYREDGPARIRYENGEIASQRWWLGKGELLKKDFTTLEMINRMKAWELFTPVEIMRMRNV